MFNIIVTMFNNGIQLCLCIYIDLYINWIYINIGYILDSNNLIFIGL